MSVKVKKLEVIYEDGRSESYPIIPAAIVAAEGYAQSREMTTQQMPYEATLYAGWTIARRKEPGTPDFRDWVASLIAVEETEGQGVTFRRNDSNGGDSDPMPSNIQQP